MSFMDRRISEYKTAPDVRRRKSEDKRRESVSPLLARPSIPVLERKKMFEQTDSVVVIPTAASSPSIGGHNGSASGRRGSKQRKEVSRNSSFRGIKKLKSEDSHSPVLGRPRSLASSNMSSSLWKKLRNFGHFDIQSMSIESLSPSSTAGEEHNIKKPTGASAAHEDTGHGMDSGMSNALIASCAAFTNEVGGDNDWLTNGNPVLLVRDCLSIDKKRRVGSRERMILDGELPLKSRVQSRGPVNKQVSHILLPKKCLNYPLEFIDYGASYYRNYFLDQEHQNFFGVDENIGPVAISIQREKLMEQTSNFFGIQSNSAQPMPKHFYRVIFRTSELCTLRGLVLEESIPTGAKTGTSKGIPPRDIVEYITQGELQMSYLKLGKNNRKVLQELVKLDEQELNNKYKIGIIYCKEGQLTEEDMYNNENGSPAFDEFLELLGEKVRMKGFSKYRAQLDNKTDTTGEYSVYTEFMDTEIMFHVSTLLPHTASNKQQLLRKRHIGNDIVTIIFQESGCGQFSPRIIRSHFQHIFVIVRPENPNSQHTRYRVAVTRSNDIPYFGPPIPEGGIFDKNENFKNFLMTKLINACNASLRNSKFSNMAVRTRKQYLHDLAESCTLGTTIDQANTTGRVAGLLRNIGYKKRERTRQVPTLIYTGGALTWHISLIFRNKNPLPFSEEHDNHIDCILGIAPDIIVFLDYYTKDLLLYMPTRDLSGWVVDKTRLNLFYDDSHCLSIECLESDEDTKEMMLRLQTVSPRLTSSHEAILMEFRRGPFGFLGFTISEAGVVEKVDGQAKNSGLQAQSRLLQVEDKLLCCHTHKQITDLLTCKEKTFVRAYVIPPPPKTRHILFYPELNWTGIWSSRPTHGDTEETCSKTQNGVECSESLEGSGGGGGQSTSSSGEVSGTVVLRATSDHRRSLSHTNRLSYMEAMCYNGPVSGSADMIIDDNEPIYDRLSERGGEERTKYAHLHLYNKRADSQSYRRVRGIHNKPNRESVLNLADDLMERSCGTKLLTPTCMEHTVSEVEMISSVQLSSSMQLPELKLHTAIPLGPHNRRTNSNDLKRDTLEIKKKPLIEVTSPMTPKGTVSMMTKMFSYSLSPGTSASAPGMRGSRIPTARQGSTPLKAMASASEMTKSGIPVKSKVCKSRIPSNDFTGSPVRNVGQYPPQGHIGNKVQLRSSNRRRTGNKVRPASFDLSLLLKNKKNMAENKQDNYSSSSNNSGDSDSGENTFHRNVKARKAFRRRSQSREISSESAPEDSKVLSEPEFSSEVFPRSPTTGVPISNSDARFSLPDNIPEFNEMHALAYALEEEEKKLSQNTGSQGSQDSFRNLHLTVRERTQRWEARGGSGPSNFCTLPRSFRHKATDRLNEPMSMDEYPEEEYDEDVVKMMLMLSAENSAVQGDAETSRKAYQSSRTSTSSFGSQKSGIPVPISKIHSSSPLQLSSSKEHGSVTGEGTDVGHDYHHSSVSPEVNESFPLQHYHTRMHSADDGVRSLNSSGHSPSSNENSLERRLRELQQREESPLRSTCNKMTGRNSTTQVATKKQALQHTLGREASPGSVPGDKADPSSIRPSKSSLSLIPRHLPSTTSTRRSSVPVNKLHPSSFGSSHFKLLTPVHRSGGVDSTEARACPSYNSSPAHERQLSINSIEHSLQEIEDLQNMLVNCEGLENDGIAEWIKKTNMDTLPHEVLGEPELCKDVGSPTFTDYSFNCSAGSEYSLDIVETLKAKIDYLEARLSKESEDNQDLRDRLKMTEHRFGEIQKKRQSRVTLSAAV